MAKRYRSPTLIEYGSIDQLTTGSSGSAPDYVGTVGNLNPNNPTCPGGGTVIYCVSATST